MSFYGNIKRIGSQSFQFDRVYPNRKAMDDDCTKDGVYPGRYVLVEYGERYTEQNGVRVQRDEYSSNYGDDLRNYGNVYDSTVWQKVYTRTWANGSYANDEKYVMVAELNALAPKMTLEVTDTATLKKTQDNEEELELYYGEDNEALHGVGAIEFNPPYFDEIQDTELEYLLHMPKPLELEVNEAIDYHQEKFDIYHSYTKEADGANFIGWKPKPESGVITDTDNGGKKIEADTPFSKQELNMYLPAFGDVLGALYDTLFGQAATNGGMRPYFIAQGLAEELITNPTAFTGDADISKILANNSQGLAGVLKALFTDSTLPGKVRYYLSSDWLAKNTDDDSNIPGILNKPKVVFDNDANFQNHYKIDYTNWSLTNIIATVTRSIDKIKTAPNDENNVLSQQNQNNIEVTFNGTDLVTIKGNLNELNTFASTNQSQGSAKWIGLDIEARYPITTLKYGGYQLTDDDVAESATLGLNNFHIVLWLKAENVANNPITITLSNNEITQNIQFQFIDTGA